MILSELYSTYYNAVARILTAAVKGHISDSEMRDIVRETAFEESILTICPALKSEHWQLLLPDGTTPLQHEPTMPLTMLEKRWLKAIYLDPRVRLFTDGMPEDLEDADPLFTADDYTVFDKYSDGDDYEDEGYIARFRMILDALKSSSPLCITSVNRHGFDRRTVMIPRTIEYSEKDDKFRVIGDSTTRSSVINISRITECHPYEGDMSDVKEHEPQWETVEFDLYDTRRALERVLMHFAHFEKEVVQQDEKHYHVTLRYEHSDQTEILIRILSFGPMVKVTAPRSFILLIKMRLERQKKYIPQTSTGRGG